MKRILCLIVLLSSLSTFAEPEPYTLDSIRHEGIPKGNVTRHLHKSDMFKGTIREYFIYVPKQYSADQAAALMVFQDGHAYVREDRAYKATIVMDNLIHKKEMPVTIGIFINPGVFAETLDQELEWQTPEGLKSNRSFEYDSLGSAYVTMLEKEILPLVAKDYNITSDPERRAICGASSGGICAFTAAWERPDLFRKVLSHIGSYVDLRGGHVYPFLIRKSDKKPLRIYLQDGSNDIDNEYGNWWLSNQQMAASFKYKSYDYIFSTDEGDHGPDYAAPKLPDAMRWLWRDTK